MNAKVQQWELLNPEGTVVLPQRGKLTSDVARPGTLESKTVALLWNAKTNGDLFLSRIGELLSEHVKDVKVVKLWEVDPATERYGPGAFPAELVTKVKSLKPDLVIGAQAD
jgi:hypothetical protein